MGSLLTQQRENATSHQCRYPEMLCPGSHLRNRDFGVSPTRLAHLEVSCVTATMAASTNIGGFRFNQDLVRVCPEHVPQIRCVRGRRSIECANLKARFKLRISRGTQTIRQGGPYGYCPTTDGRNSPESCSHRCERKTPRNHAPPSRCCRARATTELSAGCRAGAQTPANESRLGRGEAGQNGGAESK